MQKDEKQGKPFAIIAIAVAVVTALSFVPWSNVTNGAIKDFNLIGDILKGNRAKKVTADEPLDPDLKLALEAEKASVANAAPHGQPLYGYDTAHISREPLAPKAPRVDGTVVFEDYSHQQTGLANLRRAIDNRGRRPARIAVIGDSYIEGDIFTMDLRQALQDKYGGQGVGYVPVSSPLTGFRVSVAQKCEGWTVHDIRKTKGNRLSWLGGEYCTADAGAVTVFSGVKRSASLKQWQDTRLVFVAPADGTIKITTDAGETIRQVKASDAVQQILVPGATGKASLTTDIAGLEVLGMWLDGTGGVAVDNMSLRGNSGISHRNLNAGLCRDMGQYVDYDCIVVEYGINALSSQQSDYSGYGKLMLKVVQKLKECYPAADIIVMGIGDRGQKVDGTVHSLPTSAAMVNAQRDVARLAGVLFWDTREAMGGENAVVEWRESGMINADYIHLNAKGGARLSQLFFEALEKSLVNQ